MRWLLGVLLLTAACAQSIPVEYITPEVYTTEGRRVIEVDPPAAVSMPGPPVGLETPRPSPTPTPTPAPERAPEPEPRSPPLPPPPAAGALVDAFLAGYRAEGGDPAWEEHLVNDVIPCESRWNPLARRGFLGLAQFHPGTWEQARRSPEADWRDPYEQGCAVARWMALIPGRWGTTVGWPHCWWE